ncbi:MAG: hypothetical protein PHF81_03505 [Flavobacterium sp.]|nr:hypothetical protein [Flavobacterium sp.]
MINKLFKASGSMLMVGVFILISSGCRNDKNTKNEMKTNFSSCEEVISYVKYRAYTSLEKEWGEARLGHISLDNNGDFQIDLVWNKIKVNGRIVQFTFTKGPYGPESFVMINCDYREGNTYVNEDASDSDYSISNDYDDDSHEVQAGSSEFDSTDSNENSSLSDKSNSNKPKYIIYDLGQSFNYDEAESECIKREMRLPDYDELLDISNSPELVKNLKANDKSLSYWSSTDYIEGQPFSNMESVHGDNLKKYKKNYNPFTDKTIMTDTDIKMKKNCLCIEN